MVSSSLKVSVCVADSVRRPPLRPPKRPPPPPCPPPGRLPPRAARGRVGRGRTRSCCRRPERPVRGTLAEARAQGGDLLAAGRAGGERLGEVEAPAQRVAARAVGVDRAQVDAGQLAARIALEAAGEGGFERGGDRGKADLRIVDRLAHEVGAQPQVELFRGLPIAAELEDGAAVGVEGGVAAGQRGDGDALPVDRVEEVDVGGLDQRIAELLEAGRAFFAREAGEQVEPRGGGPVEPRAIVDERAEVAQLRDLGVGVGGQPADRRGAAREGDIEADRGVARGAAEVGAGDDAGAARFAVEVGAVEPNLEGGVGVARGEREQRGRWRCRRG